DLLVTATGRLAAASGAARTRKILSKIWEMESLTRDSEISKTGALGLHGGGVASRLRAWKRDPSETLIDYPRSSTLITCRAVQAPPRADFTPRAVSARATPRKLLTPLA